MPQTGIVLDGNVPCAPTSHWVVPAAAVAFPSFGKSDVSEGVHEKLSKNWKLTILPFSMPPTTPIRVLAAGLRTVEA